MTATDFYNLWEKLANGLGASVAHRFKIIGWTRQDAQQQAKLTLWTMSGKPQYHGKPGGYLAVCIRRALFKHLRDRHVMLPASEEALVALVAPVEPDTVGAPEGLQDYLAGRPMTRQSKSEVLAWLR